MYDATPDGGVIPMTLRESKKFVPKKETPSMKPTLKHFEAIAGDDGQYWTRRVWVQGDREWEEMRPTGVRTHESVTKEIVRLYKDGKIN